MTRKIRNIIESYYTVAICIIVLLYILHLVLLPVDVRITFADVKVMHGIEVIAGFVIVTCMIKRFQKGTCKACFHMVWSDVFVLLWLVYYCCRVWFWTDNPCATDAIKGVMMFAFYFALRLFFSHYVLADKLLILFLLLFCGYEALSGMMQLMGGNSNHLLFMITGTFYNPGPYSACLALGVVIILSMLNSDRNGMYLLTWGKVKTIHLYYIILILTLLVLPATWSRSAFMALAIMCLWIYRDKYYRYRYYLWGAIIIVVIGMYFMKKGSADGRLLIWLSSLTSWKHSPLIGTGIGGFFHAEAEGTSELFANNGYIPLFDSADVTNFMCNDYLKIILEQGVIGALLCAFATITLLVKLYGHSKSLCYGVIALLIFSMTSYPFELLPYKLIVVLIAAWGNSQPMNETKGHVVNRLICKPLRLFNWKSCVLIAMVLLLSSLFVNTEMKKRIEADMSYRLFCNSGQEAFINDYYELLPLEHDNFLFLFDFGKLLRSFGRYNESNAVFQKGTLISNDPMFYILIGNNFKDMNFYDLAEQAYNKAFSVMPNRLYPLYQLMLLYHESGNKQKTKAMAKRVIDMKPKVESPATRDMKKKARELL